MLDFGLAKLEREDEPSRTESDHASPRTADEPGHHGRHRRLHVAEQALGRAARCPHRSLFARVSCSTRWPRGRPPFRGETSAAIFDAILNPSPPPVVRANPELPDELDRLLQVPGEGPRASLPVGARALADLKRLRRDTTSGASAVHASGAATPHSARQAPAMALAGGTAPSRWPQEPRLGRSPRAGRSRLARSRSRPSRPMAVGRAAPQLRRSAEQSPTSGRAECQRGHLRQGRRPRHSADPPHGAPSATT